MTTFVFVRHGQTEMNKLHKIQGQLDYPLNETGRSQAKKCGKFLKGYDKNFDLIMSSPLSRAYDTALIIASEIGYEGEVIANPAFIERCFGDREGMDVCDEVFVDINNDTAYGLEKSYDLRKRVIDEMKRLSKLYPDKRILVVSHSHTIKAVTTYVDPNNYKFRDFLYNCGLCYYTVDNDEIKVEKFNVKTID